MRITAVPAVAFVLLCATGTQALAASAGTTAPSAAIDDHVWHTFTVAARPFTAALAPADEYFGRFKISNLGMRNLIHDMNIEGDSPLALPLQQGRIRELAGSLANWANRFSRDKWLPGTTASYVRFLERKRTPETATIAAGFIAYLNDRFAGTRSAKWYVSLVNAHVPVSDVDTTIAPAPFHVFSPFDADVLQLDRGIPKP